MLGVPNATLSIQTIIKILFCEKYDSCELSSFDCVNLVLGLRIPNESKLQTNPIKESDVYKYRLPGQWSLFEGYKL